MSNSNRYREVDFIGARILESTELLKMQQISRGTDSSGNKLVYDLDQIYRIGATQNIALAISGLTVSFSKIDSTQPMAVFVRGRWEPLDTGDLPAITLSSIQTFIYINYALRIVTSAEDVSLVDAGTGQPTANMGELDLTVSATDTSGVALDTTTQLEKNSGPIILFQFTNSGSLLTRVILDNVRTQAYGKLGVAGLVKTTTGSSAGVVVATDDSRMTDARSPIAGSVVDASVRIPLPTTGTNSDGSTKYSLGTDAGGISADKVIWQEVTERVSDALAWLKAQVISIAASLTAHIGVKLGSSATHPMPTSSDVGAAPLSHVNMDLGLNGSHTLRASRDSGGFTVIRTPGAAADSTAAYGVSMSGVLQAGLLHNGDVLSLLSQSNTAYPDGVDGDGPRSVASLGTMSVIASILAAHVNKVSHTNPHGVDITDLGFSILAQPRGYLQLPDSLSGMMIQWGHHSVADGSPGTAISYSPDTPAFPHACWAVLVADDFGSGASRIMSVMSVSRTGFTLRSDGSGNGAYWLAVGS